MYFSGRWPARSAVPEVIECVESGELRVVGDPVDCMVVIGHCLSVDDDLETGLAGFVRTGALKYVSDWPGCYSIAVFRSRSVTLIADPVGQFPLYLSRAGGNVVFGSSAAALAERVRAVPDQVSLMVTLTCPDVDDLVGSRCMFSGVERLRAGHVAHIENGRITVEPGSQLRVDPRISLADAAARLRLSLTRAVEARVATAHSLTSDLSGGLDSTSLAFLAARKTSRLPVLTYVNKNRPVADDVEHASRVAKLAAELDHHVLAGTDDDLPYQSVEVLDDEPHSSAVAMGSMKARLRRAADFSSDTHLVGEGGDIVLGAPAVYLADLTGWRDIGRLRRHCVAWARMRNRSPMALLSRAFAVWSEGRSKALTGLARQVEQGHPVGVVAWELDNIGYWSAPQADWLTRSARRTLSEHIHECASRLSTVDELAAGDVVTLGRLRLQALTQRAVRTAGAQFGIAVHAPYLDTDVVRACLSLSAARRASVTTPKPLLRAALSGLVPEAVLTRPTKGDYTADAYLGVRRAAPALRRLLQSPATADYGLIEPEPVRRALELAIQGMPTPWGALNQWIAVEVWLRGQAVA